MAYYSMTTSAGFMKIARSGIDNISESLNMITQNKLSLDILWAGSVPTPKLSEVTGNPELMAVGVYMPVRGETPGLALVLIPLESAFILIDLLVGQSVGSTSALGELETSAIKEVANIITSSYIKSIADYYCVIMMPDPPMLAVDMAGAIIDNVLLDLDDIDDETLSIVTRFSSEAGEIDGYFLYLPEDSSFVEGDLQA